MKVISRKWEAQVIADLRDRKPIDVTTGEPIVKKFLVSLLTCRNIPFKVHNMGCGVSRITTDTDTCPCCGKPLGVANPAELVITKEGNPT